MFEDQFSTDIPLGSFPDQPVKSCPGCWAAYPHGWHDTSGHGSYDTASTVSVSGGQLHVHLHYANGEYKVAALMPILASGDWNQLYGRYEIRFTADPVDGYKTAWLLWPKSEVWPRDGEIDFPEGDLNSTIHGFVHRQGATSGGDQYAVSTGVTYTAWHTAVIEWMPGRVNFLLDGVTVGTTTERIPNTPMRWVIQTETRLGAEPPQSAVGDVDIDYVKVWSYTP